jgi:hypothetical protein
MPSGRLVFATRRVDLMAAGMRAPLALCADGMTILPPHEVWEKNLTRWWFEFKERLHVLGLSLATGQIIGPHATLTVRFVVQLLWLMLHQNNDIRGEELNTCHIFDVQCSFSSITK